MKSIKFNFMEAAIYLKEYADGYLISNDETFNLEQLLHPQNIDNEKFWECEKMTFIKALNDCKFIDGNYIIINLNTECVYKLENEKILKKYAFSNSLEFNHEEPNLLIDIRDLLLENSILIPVKYYEENIHKISCFFD